jgi:amino acid transporter
MSEQAKQRILGTINERGRTDEMIPEWWVLLPVIAVVISVGVTILGFFFAPLAGIVVSLAVGVVTTIIVLLLIYKLLKRHNLHLVREANLRRGIIDYLRFKTDEKGAGQNVYQYTQAMEGLDREAVATEKPQDALLWTILCIIPIIEYVAYILIAYWLTTFDSNHDRRFFAFAQNTQYAGSQIGMGSIMPPMWRQVPDRSFILYVVLTIITFGLFALYWAYVLIKDMNEHFKNEWEFEDALVRELQRM